MAFHLILVMMLGLSITTCSPHNVKHPTVVSCLNQCLKNIEARTLKVQFGPGCLSLDEEGDVEGSEEEDVEGIEGVIDIGDFDPEGENRTPEPTVEITADHVSRQKVVIDFGEMVTDDYGWGPEPTVPWQTTN